MTTATNRDALARRVRRWLPAGILAVVVGLAAVPFLQGRYPLLLDFAVGPQWDPLGRHLVGFQPPVYGGWLPLRAAVSVFPPDVAAKLLLPGGLVLAAVAGYTALPGGRWARCYGAVVLVVNPFVYARALTGQWAVVWGLAALPLALVTVDSYLDRAGARRLLAAAAAVTFLSISAHLLFAGTILLGSLVAVRVAATRDRSVLRRAATVVVTALPVNAFWLVPAVVDGRDATAASAAELTAFAPDPGSLPPLFATASMHGFWRGGYTFARDLVPGIEVLFAVVLCVAVYGAVTHWRSERGPVVRALVLTAVLAVVLGTGPHGPTGPLFAWLADTVPLFGGMRDANKFVALLVLAYAYLGALGVSALLATLRGAVDRPDPTGLGARVAATVPGRRTLATAALVAVLAVPVAYTFPMVTGYAGQVTVGDYPDDYDGVDATLAADGSDGQVLFVPWHGYVDLPWLDAPVERAETPARHVFSPPVIQGDTVEHGAVYSTSANPVSGRIESLFGLGPAAEPSAEDGLAAGLAHADVDAVVLARTADWRAYDEVLQAGDGLALARSTDHLRVYRVTADVPRAYAFDGPPTGDGLPAGEVDPVAVRDESPVAATVGGTDREYVAVAPRQVGAGGGWELDGEAAVGRRGARQVFPADAAGGTLRYAPFYHLYVPSYVVSALTVVSLGGFWLTLWRHRSSASRDDSEPPPGSSEEGAG